MPDLAAPSEFGPDALAFFRDLDADNSKAFWTDHKPRFEREVAAPMRSVLGVLAPEFGPFKTFRMHRDVRFSADTSPYKTMHGAAAQTAGGSVHYLHVDADGVLVAAGAYVLARDQLARYREAILDEASGRALVAAIEAVERAGVPVSHGGPDPLKTAPRGVDPDHPRAAWLRWKGCVAVRQIGLDGIGHGSIGNGVAGTVAEAWRTASPLVEWLDSHVGPTTESRFR